MYLPNSLYERAPYYWLFIGLLLMVLGVYLGLQMDPAFLYLGVTLGVLSFAWGVRVFLHRTRKPGEANVASPGTSAE